MLISTGIFPKIAEILLEGNTANCLYDNEAFLGKSTLQCNKRGQCRTRTKAVLQVTTNKTRSYPLLFYVTARDSFPICCMCTSGGILGTVRGYVWPKFIVKYNDRNIFS